MTAKVFFLRAFSKPKAECCTPLLKKSTDPETLKAAQCLSILLQRAYQRKARLLQVGHYWIEMQCIKQVLCIEWRPVSALHSHFYACVLSYLAFSPWRNVWVSHTSRPTPLLLEKETRNNHVFLFWYSYVRRTYFNGCLKLYRQLVFMCAHLQNVYIRRRCLWIRMLSHRRTRMD